MASEPRRRTRNLLVASGVTLLFYGLAGIVYSEGLRSDRTPCGDGGEALIVGSCYSVWLLLLPIVLAGAGLLVGGLVGARWRRERPEDELYLSSWVHAVAWLSTSLVVLPLLALAIQTYRQRLQDTVFTIELVGVTFEHVFLLTLLLIVGVLVWVPYMALLTVRYVRWRIFLARYEARTEQAAA